MSYKVRYVDPGRNYRTIKEEIDAVFVEVLSRGRVRRARLYYLRERTGKAARIRERVRSDKR